MAGELETLKYQEEGILAMHHKYFTMGSGCFA